MSRQGPKSEGSSIQRDQKLANEITLADIQPLFESVLGHPSAITDELIQEALDPVRNAQGKKSLGGSNDKEVERQLVRLQKHLDRDSELLAARTQQVADAKSRLEQEVNVRIS